MAKKQKAPVVVAELGRPETAAEKAARKATDSRLYRQRKTVNNLVFSLIVSLGLVLILVLVVPRGTGAWEEHEVDVAELAEQASVSAGRTLVAPEVPDGWKAKQAVLSNSDGINVWQIHYTTASERYATVVQAFTSDGAPVNETWAAESLERQQQTGSDRLGGVEWAVYDHTDRDASSANMLFGLRGEVGDATLLVYGTDTPGELMALGARIGEQALAAHDADQIGDQQ